MFRLIFWTIGVLILMAQMLQLSSATIDYGNYTWRGFKHARAKHSDGAWSFIQGDTLITGGGAPSNGDLNSADQIYNLNLVTLEWTKGGKLPYHTIWSPFGVYSNKVTFISTVYSQNGKFYCDNKIVSYSLTSKTSLVTSYSTSMPSLCTASSIVFDNKLYMFGGELSYSDRTSLFVYALDTNEMLPPFTMSGDEPGPRSGSIIFRSPQQNKFRIYGGMFYDQSSESWFYCSTEDMFEYDVAEKKWTKIPQQQPHPTYVLYSSTNELPLDTDKNVLMYGGYGADDQPTNQNWLYNPSSNTWTKLADGPSTRTFAPHVRWRDSLIIVDGRTPEEDNLVPMFTDLPLNPLPPPEGSVSASECALRITWANPTDIKYLKNVTYDIKVTRSDGKSEIIQKAHVSDWAEHEATFSSKALMAADREYDVSVRVGAPKIPNSEWSSATEVSTPASGSGKANISVNKKYYRFACSGSNCASSSDTSKSETSVIKNGGKQTLPLCPGSCIYNSTGLCCTMSMEEFSGSSTTYWTESKCSSALSLSFRYYYAVTSSGNYYSSSEYTCSLSGTVGTWNACPKPVEPNGGTKTTVSMLLLLLCLVINLL